MIKTKPAPELEAIKRTKIITTIGPSTHSLSQIEALFNCGMNTIRLNFSHGDYQEQGARIDWAKQLMVKIKKPISIMLDTKGPEIRIGKVQQGQQMINKGSEVIIYTTAADYNNREATAEELTVSYDIAQDLKSGNIILVDDGKLQLIVEKVVPGKIYTKAFNNHLVKTNKRVNLPGVLFSLPFLSQKDIDDITFGVKKGIDYVAASFVNCQKDVLAIRGLLQQLQAPEVQIIAKIESQIAVDNIDEIIAAADGVMVARGDLGLEIPYYNVPYYQKKIIRKCRKAGKFVIVATQMLESMTDNPSPTRAEVTDVYFATELGADATMLSGESANGSYPLLATKTMATINRRAGSEFFHKLYYQYQLDQYLDLLKNNGFYGDIIRELAIKCRNGEYPYTVVLSETGNLLKMISKARVNTVILGISKNNNLYTKFGCIHSVFMNKVDDYDAFKTSTTAVMLLAKKWGAKANTKILFVHKNKIKTLVIK